ncbi:MAG: DUF4230 domain-containing protein [Treponema sp.]|nr:DUF4230 domain-containing protein [Treponema sp.]
MEKKINEKKSLLREAEKVERQRKPHRQHSVLSGILTKIIIILILIMIMLGGGYFFFTKKMQPQKEINVLVVQNQLSYCQELVTLKYRYSDILSIKKSVALSKSFSIIKYTGIIRIGIEDITLSDIEVYNEGKGVKIKLPDVEVLGNDITSQEVFDESHSIFVPITLDDVFVEIERSKQATLEELLDEGIMNEARESAKKVVQQIMMSAGFEEVIVV